MPDCNIRNCLSVTYTLGMYAWHASRIRQGLLQPPCMFDKECSGVGVLKHGLQGQTPKQAGWTTLPDGCILIVQRSFRVFYALIKWLQLKLLLFVC